ncbi:protein phosphatase 1 regulatory subunit 3C-B-like [Seriola lalandi dorsalis]|uniref:Protein phosphatase 1 regulatory subunit 3C-B-like n=1 Tax=Seriola lalandi dorsalis TaxID=1841481 RepID=A0A3B4YGS0_SERLL|nr:protein phosphatase 1 regulatory subunit 3C-B-like [Seriola lalandi dorsalis]XP_023263299.1 protein phosphatase 1 regulatory subunit 3C-B-like [Seriola lalandi dorsalis]XP_056259784.1 protein phosphatase 1 regulatory subunit 3C-B [Seriola aureovittata]
MNCTRVLHAFGSHPKPAVMPVDLAVCLSLSQRQPLYQLLSMSPTKPAKRPCQPTDSLPKTSRQSPYLSTFSSSSLLLSSPVPSEPRSCFRRDSGTVNKKRVVFADAKGLALTAVRLFIPEPSSTTPALLMKPLPAKLQAQQSTPNNLRRYKLRLAFPQPTLDFKAFLARLREMHVQLESCNISERSLSGKVCVSHVSIEKAVHIRVTFDSWRSHHDIPCTFLQQLRCGGSDMGVFAFDLSLPQNIDPKERIEFCVSFRPGPGVTPHWDDNRGKNYRVCMDASNANQSDANHFYPTLSKHQSPSWPSHVSLSMQNSADLQYLQKSLSRRVRAEWKTLCPAK